jgi:hypothetical protein
MRCPSNRLQQGRSLPSAAMYVDDHEVVYCSALLVADVLCRHGSVKLRNGAKHCDVTCNDIGRIPGWPGDAAGHQCGQERAAVR